MLWCCIDVYLVFVAGLEGCAKTPRHGIFIWMAGVRQGLSKFWWKFHSMELQQSNSSCWTYSPMHFTFWGNGEPNNWRNSGEICVNIWPNYNYTRGMIRVAGVNSALFAKIATSMNTSTGLPDNLAVI